MKFAYPNKMNSFIEIVFTGNYFVVRKWPQGTLIGKFNSYAAASNAQDKAEEHMQKKK